MTKCTLVFLSGIVLSASAFAFFAPMMQMPGQMMKMMNPQQQQQPCVCKCDVN